MTRGKLMRLGTVGALAGLVTLAGAGQAFADYQPQQNDIVGVGGDTPQYGADFVINGDTVGDAGFDASTGVNRVVNFDATADANGRQAYTQGSTEASPSYLDPTIVLRAGQSPVQRPQSSSAAIAALVADNGSAETINYVAAASQPSTTQGGAVTGGLDVVEFATDTIRVAVDQTSTDAPAGLSASELAGIYDGTYKTWNALPGNTGGSANTIIPLLPPSTSSVYKSFVAALTAADPSFTIDTAVVRTVEQNDPTAITSLTTGSADAIVPFSQGRLNLWNAGYFHNPVTVFPGGSALSPGVKLLTATAPDSSAALSVPITDYIIFRARDLTSTNPYQPGGSLNWVQTLFYDPSGPTPYIDSPEGQALITSAGLTPNYQFVGTIT